jgi:hypothetical protein
MIWLNSSADSCVIVPIYDSKPRPNTNNFEEEMIVNTYTILYQLI